MTVLTPQHNYIITLDVEEIVEIAGIKSGLVNVYVQGAAAGILIQ
nr:hypothetical protein [uncultured Draconibacterium sp.]